MVIETNMAKMPEGLEESTLDMSNFDHTIDDGLEDELKSGKCCTHAAWNFNGDVWYDKEANMFFEMIWRYKSHVETVSAQTLEELIEVVNDEYGAD